MKEALSRPDATYGSGLFRNDHFQIAYATTDLDRALALFGERFGVKEFRSMDGDLAAGGKIRMRIGWAGGVMYELLWAEGPGSEVFRHGLPAEGFAITPHHLGYYVPTAEAWDAVQEEIAAAGFKVLHSTDVPGFLKAIIVEAPGFGQLLEYILPEAGGLQFFETAPSN
ncbi:VOC family protein [Phenylobacterium sp. LjRoot225]|uniref:VOC family protein n=1 Tax=Phenylobacterium sp. LjRoot225 TaxID=3342285 RepID=UPI003ED01DB8